MAVGAGSAPCPTQCDGSLRYQSAATHLSLAGPGEARDLGGKEPLLQASAASTRYPGESRDSGKAVSGVTSVFQEDIPGGERAARRRWDGHRALWAGGDPEAPPGVSNLSITATGAINLLACAP